MIDLNNVAFSKPEKYETFSYTDSNGNTVVIREPFLYDFGKFQELKRTYKENNHWFYLSAIQWLAESFNGKPGVTVQDIGKLDRKCYAKLMGKINAFQFDLVPDVDTLPKYVQDIIKNTETNG